MRETIIFLSTAFILTSGAALGQEKATPQQVVQKVQQAAGYLIKKGEAGLTTFKERRSDYVWANTYVFVIDCRRRRSRQTRCSASRTCPYPNSRIRPGK